MIVSFNSSVASEVGVTKAILLQNIEYWVNKNMLNKHNIHEGIAYTYNTYDAWAELFPFVSKRTIKGSLIELEKRGLVSSAYLSKNKFDRTKYYTITEKYFILLETCLEDNISATKERLFHSEKTSPSDGAEKGPSSYYLHREPLKTKVYSQAVTSTFTLTSSYFSVNLLPKTEKQVNDWLDTIEKLNRIDNWEFDEIEQITKAAREDEFWSLNFMSLLKLRKKDKNGTMYIDRFEPLLKRKNHSGSKTLKDSWV